MWDWLQQLSGGAGAFLGALAGSFFGLLAILAGALYNAHLNRKRDDRIRQQDTYAAAQAVLGELQAVHTALARNIVDMQKDVEPGGGFVGPDLNHMIHLFPMMLPRLGSIEAESIKAIVNAYTVIEQYSETLTLIGATIDQRVPGRNMVFTPMEQSAPVITMTKSIIEQIETAITHLKAVPKG